MSSTPLSDDTVSAIGDYFHELWVARVRSWPGPWAPAPESRVLWHDLASAFPVLVPAHRAQILPAIDKEMQALKVLYPDVGWKNHMLQL